MTTAITTLLAKLGKPLRADVGKSPNGAYHLVEAQDGDRYVRVMVEANCPPEQVARAVEAALACLARGRT
jgi:hypothetical protein